MITPEDDVLGYVHCPECNSPKAIRQGAGKRRNFLKGRCKCGPDNRTGADIQKAMNAFQPLGDIEAQINALNDTSEDTPEIDNQSESLAIDAQSPTTNDDSQPTQSDSQHPALAVAMGAVFGFIGGKLITLMRA